MFDTEEIKKINDGLAQIKFELMGGWKGILETVTVEGIALLCKGFVFGMGWYFAKSVWE